MRPLNPEHFTSPALLVLRDHLPKSKYQECLKHQFAPNTIPYAEKVTQELLLSDNEKRIPLLKYILQISKVDASGPQKQGRSNVM